MKPAARDPAARRGSRMGFSWEGILLDIVMLLPSIVSAILPPQGAPALTTELAPVFAVLERAGQVGC
ncbi:MAG TPA: hypothetical protein PKH46_04295, partial [Candidatus Cryosericum sp.]|nr:hypothetical protein [Candidatus Cryosericum sp.]